MVSGVAGEGARATLAWLTRGPLVLYILFELKVLIWPT
jgi:hypothetical protein